MTHERVIARINQHPVTGSPDDMRAAFDALSGYSVSRPQITRGGVPARVFGPDNAPAPDIVWLHGGGYIFGSSQSHSACAAELGRLTSRRVWVPDYRLAPEHPWPAQRADALSFIETFTTPVTLVGDSAGGHLALNTALARPDLVRALVLISPNTDRSGQSTTRQCNSHLDVMNDDSDDTRLADLAFAGLDPAQPQVSPILADLSVLPPVWVTASTKEVLLDDTLLLIRALGRAGVAVQADIIDHLFHMWTLWPDDLPQARMTLEKIAVFIRGPALRL